MAILDYDDTSGQTPFVKTTERQVLAEVAKDMGMSPPALDDPTGWFHFPKKMLAEIERRRNEAQRLRWARQNEENAKNGHGRGAG